MSSNYEWQKHQVDQRIQARLQEADTNRRAKMGRAGRVPLLRRIVTLITGSLVRVGWVLRQGVSPTDFAAREREKRERLA